MADKKISELTPLTGANLADNDEFAVVDTSAVETKAITFGELKTALDTSTGFVRITGDTMTGGLTVPTVDINGGTIDGTVIGGSTPAAISGTTGTFSGNLTVDTNTLFVDAANNRVGVGTGSPAQKLHVVDADPKIQLTRTSDFFYGQLSADGFSAFTNTNGNAPVIFKTAITERMRITSAGNVGIGTSSPARNFHLVGDGTTTPMRVDSGAGASLIDFKDAATTADFTVRVGAIGDNFVAYAGTTERMRIDASGNVGVGTTTPASFGQVTSAVPSAKAAFAAYSSGGAGAATGYVFATGNYGWLDYDPASTNGVRLSALNNIRFGINSNAAYGAATFTERMRIDASGNLLVGKTSPSVNSLGVEARGIGLFSATRESNPAGYFTRNTDDGDIVLFRKDGTTVGSIGAYNGDVYVGNGDTGITFADGSDVILPVNASTPAYRDAAVSLGNSSYRFKDLYLGGQVLVTGGAASAPSYSFIGDTNTGISRPTTDAVNIVTGGTERMRIDSSGNLLVGKTTPVAGASSAGAIVAAIGRGIFTVDGGNVLVASRLTSDGDIMEFAKDGTTVGSIGAFSGYIYIANNNGDGMALQNNSFRPATNTGANQDNVIDLGLIGSRFDDIYATNGTIQTSDRNEKQDIEELTEAEQRVAVAAKGLLRKFRWKDAVAEKGDDARIHFGIIAQDLQAAFEAEGLDAGRYAMFISSTWTDEETGEERSRMGVRYPQLLAFIIAAI